MVLQQNKTLHETQVEFNRAYPFLRIEFYRNSEPGFARKQLIDSMLLTAAGLKKNGQLEINDSVTVGELEDTFQEKFGLHVRVSRRSGNLWLETTTMTDNWTLEQQNAHGREISEHPKTTTNIKGNDPRYD